MTQRFQFYNEKVYAQTSTTSWTVKDIVAEIIRKPGNSRHVDEPKDPICVYGYTVDELKTYAKCLAILADRQRETYTRRGVEHERAVKKSTPILLVAVASYPEPDMNDTPARQRWVDLVVQAAAARWKRRLRSIIAHADESHFHLHIIVDNVGQSAKTTLHAGHAAAARENDKEKKGEAYRSGCREAQDWYHVNVGQKMGWLRGGDETAKPGRPPRPVALRKRQAEIERLEAEALARETELVKRARDLVAREEELAAAWRAFRVSVEAGAVHETQNLASNFAALR
jgi:hypothetical protein